GLAVGSEVAVVGGSAAGRVSRTEGIAAWERRPELQPVVTLREGGGVEGVRAGAVGGGAQVEAVAEQPDGDSGNARLTRVLYAISIQVSPNEVAKRGGGEAVFEGFEGKQTREPGAALRAG